MSEIPKEVLLYISKQLNLEALRMNEYDWEGRTIKYHRAQIREFFGFNEATTEDIQSVTEWLSKLVFYHEADLELLRDEVYRKFRELNIEPPTVDRIDRITKSAIFTYENQFFKIHIKCYLRLLFQKWIAFLMILRPTMKLRLITVQKGISFLLVN